MALNELSSHDLSHFPLPRDTCTLWLLVLLLLMSVCKADQTKCLTSFNSDAERLRDLSAVMAQDHNWDILHRRGESTVCMEEGHRFFFALLFYQAWRAPAATSDFGACLPRECDPVFLSQEVLPQMYHHFFDHHVHVLPDGTIDESKSLQYSITVKEYKSSLNLSFDLHWPIFVGAAFALVPSLLATLWELTRILRKESAKQGPILVQAFSVFQGCRELVSVPQGEEFSGDLCWVRVAYVGALITLHVTQGSKWRYIDVLERNYMIFAAVRPLALVNDAFIQLSAYLCACSDSRASRKPNTSAFSRLRKGLLRSWNKYLRQLPVCLFWSWFYLFVLPSVPYNPYNHAFPWFGIRWYHATGKCMNRKWRYSFLLGDVGALLLQDGDSDWYSGNGNPCVNLWNFQLEIQAFTLTTCILALGRPCALSIFAVVLAFGFSRTDFVDVWWVHHSRGIALQMLVLCSLGFACQPLSGKWRHLRVLGACFMLIALLVHGISRGGWGEQILKEHLEGLQQQKLLTTGVWQAALAVGTAFLCEGCRVKTPTRPCRPWLAAMNRLAFGMNVAHPFVQFFVEAHTSLNDRVFSIFTWPTQLALIFCLTAIPAVLVYILLQRPWSLLLQHTSDTLMTYLQRT